MQTWMSCWNPNANSSEAARQLLRRDSFPGLRSPWSLWGRWAAAAAILLAAGGGFLWHRATPPAEFCIAEFVESQGARWTSCSLPTEAGSRLSIGILRLSEGIARLRFAQGAEVTLEGSAELELVTAQLCRLLRGSLVAHVPEKARGFTVLNPSARPIDHGTDFGVSTDATGHAQVHVMQGVVELRHASGAPPLRWNSQQTAAITPNEVLSHIPFLAEPRRSESINPERIFTSEITTRTGRGAATSVSEPRTENNQPSTVLLLKHCIGEGYGRKVLLRFDLSMLPENPRLNGARLTLDFDRSGYGYASQDDDARIAVYALTNEAADFWSARGLRWHTQPAFDPSAGRVNETEAVQVGEFTVPRGVQTGAFEVEDPRLLERIQSDQNPLLTLILMRENPITVGGGLVLGIAGNQHPNLSPPRLRVH